MAQPLVINIRDNKILLLFQHHLLYLITVIIYVVSKLYTDVQAKAKPTN